MGITAMLNSAPHTDSTVDGHNVAVYEQKGAKMHYNDKETGTRPDQYFAIMHDATPVGYGINSAPAGTWDAASIKFTDWTTGAGTIADEKCVSMSALELVQSDHANRTLWMFDQLMEFMKKEEPLKSAL